MRHGFSSHYDPKPGVSIATLAYDYPAGSNISEHSHGSDQLLYATRGVMEVTAGPSMWLIPPQFGVWVPARTVHKIRMGGAVSMRTLYFRRGLAAHMKSECVVLHMTPLFRELVLEAVRVGQLRARNRSQVALKDMLVEQLRSASPVPTSVTLPSDLRALAVAEAEIADQANRSPLSRLAARAGASVRTIERAFQRELGMTFESWRRQARLMKAVELLVGGHAVKEVAFEVGYRQTSAFVDMFRQSFGATPGAWASTLRGQPN